MQHEQTFDARPNADDSSHLLLAELEELLSLVRQQHLHAGHNDAHIALVRLVRGITLTKLQHIVSGLNNAQWLALDLGQSALHALYALQSSREESACPDASAIPKTPALVYAAEKKFLFSGSV